MRYNNGTRVAASGDLKHKKQNKSLLNFAFSVSQRPGILVFCILLIILVFSVTVYGNGDQSWLIFEPVPDSYFPIPAVMDIKKNVLIGPFVVRISMTGTVTLTSPTGAAQALSVRVGDKGFSGEVNLGEEGSYIVNESYELTGELFLGVIPANQSYTVSKTHMWYYNNTVPGVKNFNVTSTLTNIDADIQPGLLEIYSVNPFSIAPGHDVSIMLRALDDVRQNQYLATSVTLIGQWDKFSSITTSNFPPSITMTVQPQTFPNSDVRLTFTLEDPDNTLCMMQAEYKGSTANSWTPAALSSSYVSPGANQSVYWRSRMDQPNGQGIYNIRMRASDGISYSTWAAGSVTLNNTTADLNNPPFAGNLHLIVMDGATNEVVSRAPITGDKLKAAYDFHDPDGDTEYSSVLEWYRYGVLFKSTVVTGEQSKILTFDEPGRTVRKGENWYFQIKPSDGKVFGDVRALQPPVVIGNAPPRVSSVTIKPSEPHSRNDLTVEYVYFDPEGDKEGATEILWYRKTLDDYILQPIYNNRNPLPSSATTRGDEWRCAVRPRDVDGAYPADFVNSPSVTIKNAIPVVQIVSVSGTKDQNGFFVGNVAVTYNLTDEDGDLCDVSAYYQGGTAGVAKMAASVAEATEGRNVIADVLPAAGLKLTWKVEEDQPAARAEDYKIGIIPDDGMNKGLDAVTARFSVDNNSAPVAADVSISPASPFSSDDLTAKYKFSDADGDAEIGTKINWYRISGVTPEEQTSYRNMKVVPNSATRRGEKWYFTVEPRDGKESGEMKTAPTVTIQNAPPVATELVLSPANPTSDDNLEASYKYSDADGDQELGTKIKWYRNGSEQTAYENQKLILRENTNRGEEWYFTVLPNDGTTAGQAAESNRVVLDNMPPEVRITVPPEGFRDVIIKLDLIDADGDICSLKVEYIGGFASTWRPATIRESLTGIASNSLVTLTWASDTDENIQSPTNFQIRVTPNDGIVSGATVESEFFTLDNNQPPIASNLQILPSNPTTTSNLEASYLFTDLDGGKESGSEIIWFKDGAQTDSRGKILTASATAKGQSWHFTVRPKDGSKFGEVQTSAPVVIGNSPPSVRDVAISPAQPEAGNILTVLYDYRDPDSDKESGTRIQWYKNGVLEMEITVYTNEDRKLPNPVSKGQRWYAVVTPSDGTDFGEPIPSANVAVGNSIPVVENITVSGGTGEAVITYTLIDADGDRCSLKVEYQGGSVTGASWAVASIQESLTGIAPGVGLRLTWTSELDEPGQKADNYTIRITPNDGVATGAAALSPKFSFSNNNLPTASGLLILPEAPITTDDLRADYVFVDPDGDKEAKPEIFWYRNGVKQIQYNDLTVLPSSATTRDERWYYTIRVNDGKEYGRLQTSKDVVIRNSPPDATNVILAPDQPKLDDQLVAHYTYVDADKDAESGTIIEWYRNGVKAGFENYTIIPGVFTATGDEWYFTVRPGDGITFGIPRTSNKVYIANKPPVASGLDISPRNPLATDALQCSYIYNDPEGDPESGTRIIWYKNDVKQTMYDDMLRLPVEATGKNQVWYFTVQPRDGKQYGAVQKSNPVVIGNTPPRVENLSISPTYPLDKDDLTANYDFIDVDGDIEGRSEIKWFRNDIWVPDYSGKQLSSKATSDGERWYFSVTPKDDRDFGEKMASPTVEIGSPIPRVNNLTIVPAAPLTTDSLTASYIYVDPKGIPESGSQITWYKNGVAQTDYTKKILPWEATRKGEQWYYSVVPSNGIMMGEKQSSVPVTIINSPPTLSNPVIMPDKPTTNDVIVVNYVFEDADGDVESGNEIKWYRDGILQASYSNMSELPSSATRRDEKWYFSIRSRDDTDFSDLVASPTVTIGNGRPGITNLELLPSKPLTDDDLKVAYTYVDTEGDPESGTEIRWFKNDLQQSDYDDQYAVPSVATERDDKWYCTVKPRDGMDFGALFTSSVMTIGNTPPIAMEILASSNDVLRGASIDIIVYGQDSDSVDAGSALQCQVDFRFGAGSWEDLAAEYVGIPSPRWKAVFKPDAVAQLGEYDFRARFVDAAGAESNWVERDKMITVDNSPPVIKAVADNLRLPEDTFKEFELRNFGEDFEDSVVLVWGLDENSVDKTLFQVSISDNKFLEILPAENRNGQDDITLSATDTDGAEVVKTDITIIVEPVNDPPGAPSGVKITPDNPRTLDNLICDPGVSVDPDAGAVIVPRYQWYKNDVIQAGLRSNTVPYTRTLKGEVWRCEVTPSDGFADGPSQSAEVTISNTPPEVAIMKVTGDTKDIRVTFNLTDADDDNCDLAMEYRIKSQTWKTATIVESVRGVTPGTGLTLTWRSAADTENVVTDECTLRITPNDGSLPGVPYESDSFHLDNLPPGFTVTAIANPVHPRYVDVTVVSDEKLVDPPDVSFSLGEGGEPVPLDVAVIADTSWTGMILLESGFHGTVSVSVEGTDLVGNVGKAEIQKEFQIPESLPKPSEPALEQNYPNPVGKDTRIPYQIAESSVVTISIYNLRGQLVKTLSEGYKVAGFYLTRDKAAYWDGRDDYGNMAASGVYFYYLKAGNFAALRKMIISR